LLPDITLKLSGDATASTTSDGSGFYQFSSVPYGGNYTVTPSKAALAPGSPGINTVDVIVVQQHYLNILLIPPGCRLMVADVNGDSIINTVDVIAIQRFFLGLTTGIADVGKYLFIPASRNYPSVTTDKPGEDYNVQVLGDVHFGYVHRPENSSEGNACDEMSDSENPPVRSVALPNAITTTLTTNVVAPVTVSAIETRANLVGFEGDFTFDERMVRFEDPPV